MTARRLLGAVLVVAGAAGCTAFLLSASAGMRDVMSTDGGFCASGGPYVVARQCSGTDMRLLLVGILGGLLAAGVYAAGTAALARPPAAAGQAAWIALFGLLGWNFISVGTQPRAGQGGATGWLLTGALFWLLAVGGLVPFAAGVIGDLQTAGRPDPVVAGMQPLVRAVVPPGLAVPHSSGFGGWPQPAGADWPGGRGGGAGAAQPAITRTMDLLRTGLWLAASAAGAGAGIALGAALVSLLR